MNNKNRLVLFRIILKLNRKSSGKGTLHKKTFECKEDGVCVCLTEKCNLN